jgi:hypothetical protein
MKHIKKESEPKLAKNKSRAEKMKDELGSTRCYAIIGDGEWWVYYPYGGRMPLQEPNCGIGTWLRHSHPQYDGESNMMPISTIYRNRPPSAFKTKEECRMSWTPPRPHPRSEVPLPRSLPTGYCPNAANLCFTPEDLGRKIREEPLQGYPDIYVKV